MIKNHGTWRGDPEIMTDERTNPARRIKTMTRTRGIREEIGGSI